MEINGKAIAFQTPKYREYPFLRLYYKRGDKTHCVPSCQDLFCSNGQNTKTAVYSGIKTEEQMQSKVQNNYFNLGGLP